MLSLITTHVERRANASLLELRKIEARLPPEHPQQRDVEAARDAMLAVLEEAARLPGRAASRAIEDALASVADAVERIEAELPFARLAKSKLACTDVTELLGQCSGPDRLELGAPGFDVPRRLQSS